MPFETIGAPSMSAMKSSLFSDIETFLPALRVKSIPHSPGSFSPNTVRPASPCVAGIFLAITSPFLTLAMEPIDLKSTESAPASSSSMRVRSSVSNMYSIRASVPYVNGCPAAIMSVLLYNSIFSRNILSLSALLMPLVIFSALRASNTSSAAGGILLLT